jgi:hypothetical protein
LSAVSPDLLIVSTGSNNTHGHPAQDVVRAGTRSGALVMCTEVTAQCHRPGFQFVLGNAPVISRPRGVSCAGDVRVTVSSRSISVDPPANSHIGRVMSWSSPMCRGDVSDDNDESG